MATGEWFRIESGDNQGRWHLRGWMKTALRVVDGGDERGWLSISICPRCFALVIADTKHPSGDNEWTHELWHARTDYPTPTRARLGIVERE